METLLAHPDCLLELGLKSDSPLAHPDLLSGDHFIGLIEPEDHGRTGPAGLYLGWESGCHDVLSTRVVGLILLRGIIEELTPSVDLLSGLEVEG